MYCNSGDQLYIWTSEGASNSALLLMQFVFCVHWHCRRRGSVYSPCHNGQVRLQDIRLWLLQRQSSTFVLRWTSLVAQTVKSLSIMRETQVRSLGREDPLEKEMATHSSIRAWKIPWNGLRSQSMGLQRVRHNWTINIFIQPTQHMSSTITQYFGWTCLLQA